MAGAASFNDKVATACIPGGAVWIAQDWGDEHQRENNHQRNVTEVATHRLTCFFPPVPALSMLLHDAGSTPCSNLFDGIVQTGHHGLAVAEEHHGLVHVEEVIVNTSIAYRQ